jgi:hypothetical protein
MSNDPTRPVHARIDVLQMLRNAQGEAAEVSKAQAHLRGMLDEENALEVTTNPVVSRLTAMLDQIRSVADEAAVIGETLPAPYGLILKQAAHWIDVADDAFKAIKP